MSQATMPTPTTQPSPPETTEICGVDTAATAPASKSPRRGPTGHDCGVDRREPASQRLGRLKLEDRAPKDRRDDVGRAGERESIKGRRQPVHKAECGNCASPHPNRDENSPALLADRDDPTR